MAYCISLYLNILVVILVQCRYTKIARRIFKYSDIQYTTLTPDNKLNSLIYRMLFYVNICLHERMTEKLKTNNDDSHLRQISQQLWRMFTQQSLAFFLNDLLLRLQSPVMFSYLLHLTLLHPQTCQTCVLLKQDGLSKSQKTKLDSMR